MTVPIPWLERVPTYKDQQEKLAEKDLATYGFLGYPLLQSADILIYRAKYVPVGGKIKGWGIDRVNRFLPPARQIQRGVQHLNLVARLHDLARVAENRNRDPADHHNDD